MLQWSVDFTSEAKNDLNKLDENLQKRIIEKLDWLQVNFNNIIPSALGEDWQRYFKLRVGDWRLLYKVDWSKSLIIIYIIDRRDKVYKRR